MIEFTISLRLYRSLVTFVFLNTNKLMSTTTLGNYLGKAKELRLSLLLANRQVKNIFFSLVFRFAAITSNFLIVPLLINHFSETKYGILVTIISISTWFSFIDFGLANGLKNKISESLATGDMLKVRKYVSTAYVSMVKVVVCFAVILIMASQFVNWNSFIEAPIEDEHAVNVLCLYGLLFLFAKILVELINPVLLAFHKTAASSFMTFLSQFCILGVCYLYKNFDNRSLIDFGLTFFWVPLVVILLFSISLYISTYKQIAPSSKFLEKSYEKDLLKLGGRFFVIQIAVLIIFTTDNLIIGRIFGYDDVSKYNIAFRYFNIPLLIFSIILTPYWPVFAEWFVVKNTNGIKKIINRLLVIWSLLALLAIIMLMIAPFVYNIWVGKDVTVPFTLNLGMCLFCLISSWNNVYATFINGTNKLRVQFWSCIFTGLLNIPLCIYLAKYTQLGPAGVIFGTCICLLFGSVLAPLQYHKLVNASAKGIWNK